jgi:tetratricopeptide (TPR) repeat protein
MGTYKKCCRWALYAKEHFMDTNESNNPKDAAGYIKRGDEYKKRGEYDKAIEVYTAAIQLDPNYVEAYYKRGLAYFKKKDYNQAIKDFTETIRLSPNDAEAYHFRGLTYACCEKSKQAIKDYDKAIRLDPNDAEAYYSRGCAYEFFERNIYSAISDYAAALIIDPNNANVQDVLQRMRREHNSEFVDSQIVSFEEGWQRRMVKDSNGKWTYVDGTPPKKSGGCYIATAVYGSYNCPQVWTLRRYRDNSLARTACGRALIRAYYAVSPSLVKWFGTREWFQRIWKRPLDAFVARLQAGGVENTPYMDRQG